MADFSQQLALYESAPKHGFHFRSGSGQSAPAGGVRLCGACRAREARYGFRDDDGDPAADRPSTLCFGCFRTEIGRRQAIAARLARGWNATQVGLPLAETLGRLDLRRRRAQIAARHALGSDDTSGGRG